MMFAYLRNKLLLLLLLLLLVVVCCTLYNGVHANGELQTQLESPAANKNSIELLQIGKVNITLTREGGDEGKNITVNDYYSPLIVSAGDVLLALAGVNRTNEENDKTVTIISKYIVTGKDKGNDWANNVLLDSKDGHNSKWKTQFVVQGKLKNSDTSVMKGMLATAKGDKEIYLLLVNCSSANGGKSNNDAKCDLNITMGTVDNGETQNGKKITWKNGDINNVDQLTTTLQEEEAMPYLFGGTAFTTKNNKVVFVVLIANEKKKNIVAVIYFEGGEGKMKFEKLNVENVDGCIPVFFPWGENKIIMIPTHCTEEGKNQKVKKSTDTGSNWSNSTGSFARLLGFMQDKNDFTTTKINNTNVLLFTQRKSKLTKNTGNTNDAHVWFTDGKRVHNAGPIVTDDNITSASLLHTSNELFALHQNWDAKGQKNITLTRMKEQLDKITRIVVAWNNNDNVVTKLFKETLAASAANSFTDGLVGFLANRNNSENGKNEWIDEYYYVNATVTGGTKVDSGFTFKGKGKNAKWPVGKSTEDQPYNFTDPGFTLLANVTIDGGAGSGKDNSVLGVVYEENGNGDEKTVGLLCTSEGQWKVTGTGGSPKNIVSDKVKCQRGSAYLVAIVLNNSELSMHIDGKELNGIGNNNIQIDKTHNITYFYFGTDVNDQKATNNDIESHVTVTNVLLYNRPFTRDIVEKVKIPKNEIREHQTPSGSPIVERDEEKNGGPLGHPQLPDDVNNGNNNDNNKEEKTSSPSQPEKSTLCGGISGLLILLLLFGLHGCYLK